MDNIGGTNILVITFQAQLNGVLLIDDGDEVDEANPEEIVATDATVSWTNENDEIERFPTEKDDASVSLILPSLEKSIISTDLPNTSDSDLSNLDVAIGETISYQITANAPGGTSTDVSLVDRLDPGMRYVDGSAMIRSTDADLTASLVPALSTIFQEITPVIISDPAEDYLTFNLGDLVNLNDTNAIKFSNHL